MKDKLLAIHGGGDWNDASVEYLVMLTDEDPEELKKRYPGYHKCQLWFHHWLVEEGYARVPEDDELTVIYDDL